MSDGGFLLGSATGLGAVAAQGFVGSLFSGEALAQDVSSSLGFTELKRVYDDKDVQEWIIRSSGLDWTIVRPGLLTNRPATGRYRVLTASKDWRFGAISRTDVADFLVRQIDDRALIGTTPLLIT